MGLFGLDFGLITWLVGIVLGVVTAIGTILLNVQKWVIILFTSLTGAGIIIGALMLPFGKLEVDDFGLNAVKTAMQDSPFWLIGFVVLAVLGFIAQVYTNRSYELTPPEDRFEF
jgi:hypothetical protein